MSGLRSKNICNCDQALTYREALEKIIQNVDGNADAFEGSFELECYNRLAEIAKGALNHPEAE